MATIEGPRERLSLRLRQISRGCRPPRSPEGRSGRRSQSRPTLGGLAGEYAIRTLFGRPYGLAHQPGLTDPGLPPMNRAFIPPWAVSRSAPSDAGFRIVSHRALCGHIDCGRTGRGQQPGQDPGPCQRTSSPGLQQTTSGPELRMWTKDLSKGRTRCSPKAAGLPRRGRSTSASGCGICARSLSAWNRLLQVLPHGGTPPCRSLRPARPTHPLATAELVVDFLRRRSRLDPIEHR